MSLRALLLLAACASANAWAQAYPMKPVRIVVPFAAGGGVDLTKVVKDSGGEAPVTYASSSAGTTLST